MATKQAARTAAAAALAVVVAAVGLTGCAQIRQQVGDAWAVTYEVSVDSPDAVTLHDVRYEGAQRRGEAASTQERESASTRPSAGNSGGDSTWRHETIVLAEDSAMVRATPPGDRTASCRVLLDGERVIAEEHGGLGQVVTCKVTTPPFS